MAWIKVTDPEGNPVYICVEQMTRVRLNVLVPESPPGARVRPNPKPSEWASVRSIIDLANGSQAVQETQEEILAMLEKADDRSDERGAVAPRRRPG